MIRWLILAIFLLRKIDHLCFSNEEGKDLFGFQKSLRLKRLLATPVSIVVIHSMPFRPMSLKVRLHATIAMYESIIFIQTVLYSLFSFQKLTVYMAYAPTNYIVKECVQTCTESSGVFGGSSLEVNCCTASLCNHASARKVHGRLFWTLVFSFFFFWRNL